MWCCVGEEQGLISVHLIHTAVQCSSAERLQGGCYLWGWARVEALEIWQNVVED